MRQLTSLDAQFLASRRPRTVGHVSGLAILTRRRRRPASSTWRTCAGSSASGCRCCRRCAGGSSRSRSGSTTRTGSRTPTSTSTSTSASWRCRPRYRRQARRAGRARIVARPLDRSRPAVGALPDPRAAGRPGRDADEDPPRGGRRDLGRRDPERAARPHARGPRACRRRSRGRPSAPAERGRDARPRHRGLPR